MAEIETGPLIVATTHQLTKYGGRFRLTVEDIEHMAEEYQTGLIRHLQQHDPTKPSSLRPMNVSVERLDDGETALKVNFRVDEDEWNTFLADSVERGGSAGFSYTRFAQFATRGSGEPTIMIAGDAEYYTREDLKLAADALDTEEPVVLAELAQFALPDLCQVVVIVHEASPLLQTWGPAAVGALLLPTLKLLAKAGRRVRYLLRFHRPGGEALEAMVETDQRDVLDRAVAHAGQIDPAWQDVTAGRLLVYDDDRSLWLPPTAPDGSGTQSSGS